MRGIQHNLNNLQANQIAMEQAANAAKAQQANRARAEVAEKVLEKDKSKEVNTTKNFASLINPDGSQKQNHQNPESQTSSNNSENTLTEEQNLAQTPQKITHIDIKI